MGRTGRGAVRVAHGSPLVWDAGRVSAARLAGAAPGADAVARRSGAMSVLSGVAARRLSTYPTGFRRQTYRGGRSTDSGRTCVVTCAHGSVGALRMPCPGRAHRSRPQWSRSVTALWMPRPGRAHRSRPQWSRSVTALWMPVPRSRSLSRPAPVGLPRSPPPDGQGWEKPVPSPRLLRPFPFALRRLTSHRKILPCSGIGCGKLCYPYACSSMMRYVQQPPPQAHQGNARRGVRDRCRARRAGCLDGPAGAVRGHRCTCRAPRTRSKGRSWSRSRTPALMRPG